ncbi:MAG: tRNA (adenosine(37)-N6)-threonylcarbamoyltransferase complex ATPase subunit type 1 TsaE [Candidatus Colwellbacteria bacterium]|jgi:tRNA threonylcarbamoyladenosine biosynthesis protein TsaE|nr:tRNA (adenosine(37)-N6)-threonylcarbamoyltransferase complex ATPase subunit type 1 TsaE [Candidatus Colwellbacteria bacterium]MCK9497316.1 tRNA (adenosine(37)-N6)-threonylcarbamoyltransferase complex ATPase subunit type 1 TsaE [Candidatus Colwellbacteria bacterium]MDD3752341.1 tRNA (adenosine(37)-N6)-threonylcarbamoyltransferase complex ATPase subunit type 1 TsaE [Candidatus Colwellbacteria bacterium]MDD4818592.1 tRNA (adenosine(37)-N6)-threonylcarbamoyltransferase complex ATPase subunit type
MPTFNSFSEEETQKIGFKTAEKIIKSRKKEKKAQVILLFGDLGAGKTAFTKGFARFFDIDKITSPTFNLMKFYPINKGYSQLIHADLYRIRNKKELDSIDFYKELKNEENIILIEWPELAGQEISGKKINFSYGEEENKRIINID